MKVIHLISLLMAMPSDLEIQVSVLAHGDVERDFPIENACIVGSMAYLDCDARQQLTVKASLFEGTP